MYLCVCVCVCVVYNYEFECMSVSVSVYMCVHVCVCVVYAWWEFMHAYTHVGTVASPGSMICCVVITKKPLYHAWLREKLIL